MYCALEGITEQPRFVVPTTVLVKQQALARHRTYLKEATGGQFSLGCIRHLFIRLL